MYFKSKTTEIQKKLGSVPELVKAIADLEAKQKESPNNRPLSLSDLNVEIKLTNINFGKADLDLPEKEILDQMSIGERMVIMDSQGNVCGVEIKDVTYDCISFDNKCIKDISLEKLE